jgi:hypothetical protein
VACAQSFISFSFWLLSILASSGSQRIQARS